MCFDRATMTHPLITIAARSEADAIALREGSDVTSIIAIVDNDERPCLGFDAIAHRLRLDFEDLASTESEHRKFSSRAATPNHVQQIIEFAQRIRGIEGRLLCHCTAGRSRSPAAALTCLATWHGLGNEEQSVAMLFAIRRIAVPHRAMVRFADELLGRNGRLVKAVEIAQPPFQ